MKILCRSSNTVQANKVVNILGKYLYKNVDGSFKIKQSSNMCDVWLTILYQVPVDTIEDPSTSEEYGVVHEMIVNLNITTYNNKIRVNIIECDPNQRTIGYDLYQTELLNNMKELKDLVMYRVDKRISKAYEEYQFIF